MEDVLKVIKKNVVGSRVTPLTTSLSHNFTTLKVNAVDKVNNNVDWIYFRPLSMSQPKQTTRHRETGVGAVHNEKVA